MAYNIKDYIFRKGSRASSGRPCSFAHDWHSASTSVQKQMGYLIRIGGSNFLKSFWGIWCSILHSIIGILIWTSFCIMWVLRAFGQLPIKSLQSALLCSVNLETELFWTGHDFHYTAICLESDLDAVLYLLTFWMIPYLWDVNKIVFLIFRYISVCCIKYTLHPLKS